MSDESPTLIDLRELELHLGELSADQPSLQSTLRDALRYASSDPGSSLGKSRLVLAKLVRFLHQHALGVAPERASISELMRSEAFSRRLPQRILVRLNTIRITANLGGAVGAGHRFVDARDHYPLTRTGTVFPL